MYFVVLGSGWGWSIAEGWSDKKMLSSVVYCWWVYNFKWWSLVSGKGFVGLVEAGEVLMIAGRLPVSNWDLYPLPHFHPPNTNTNENTNTNTNTDLY